MGLQIRPSLVELVPALANSWSLEEPPRADPAAVVDVCLNGTATNERPRGRTQHTGDATENVLVFSGRLTRQLVTGLCAALLPATGVCPHPSRVEDHPALACRRWPGFTRAATAAWRAAVVALPCLGVVACRPPTAPPRHLAVAPDAHALLAPSLAACADDDLRHQGLRRSIVVGVAHALGLGRHTPHPRLLDIPSA